MNGFFKKRDCQSSLSKSIYITYSSIIFIISKNSSNTKNLKKKKSKWVVYLIIYLINIKYMFIIRKNILKKVQKLSCY